LNALRALRGHVNPALDIALLTAENLKLPVFDYQQLQELELYARDQHQKAACNSISL